MLAAAVRYRDAAHHNIRRERNGAEADARNGAEAEEPLESDNAAAGVDAAEATAAAPEGREQTLEELVAAGEMSAADADAIRAMDEGEHGAPMPTHGYGGDADEEGVRAPDEAYTDTLIDDGPQPDFVWAVPAEADAPNYHQPLQRPNIDPEVAAMLEGNNDEETMLALQIQLAMLGEAHGAGERIAETGPGLRIVGDDENTHRENVDTPVQTETTPPEVHQPAAQPVQRPRQRQRQRQTLAERQAQTPEFHQRHMIAEMRAQRGEHYRQHAEWEEQSDLGEAQSAEESLSNASESLTLAGSIIITILAAAVIY